MAEHASEEQEALYDQFLAWLSLRANAKANRWHAYEAGYAAGSASGAAAKEVEIAALLTRYGDTFESPVARLTLRKAALLIQAKGAAAPADREPSEGGG